MIAASIPPRLVGGPSCVGNATFVRVSCEWEFGHARRGLTRCRTVSLDKISPSFRDAGESPRAGNLVQKEPIAGAVHGTRARTRTIRRARDLATPGGGLRGVALNN